MSERYVLDTTAPGTPPATLAQAKAYLRIDSTDEDDTLGLMLEAAILACEAYTARAFSDRTWTGYFDGFPLWGPRFVLQKNSIDSVTSVEYLKWDGISADVWTTVPSTDYYLKPSQSYAELLNFGAAEPVDATEWPYDEVSERHPEESVRVVFVTAADQNLPAMLPAVFEILAAMWANRGDCLAALSSGTFGLLAQNYILQSGAATFLDPYRYSRI